jgi:hypothetical protein
MIAELVPRFGEHYPNDVVRRVAEVEFEIVLEVIKLRVGSMTLKTKSTILLQNERCF